MHANTIRAIITKTAPEELAWKMRSIWTVNINMNLHVRTIQQWMVIKMDIMMIGLGMILVPVTALAFVAIGSLLRLMSELTIEAYRSRDVVKFLAVLLGWSLVVGIMLVIVGSV